MIRTSKYLLLPILLLMLVFSPSCNNGNQDSTQNAEEKGGVTIDSVVDDVTEIVITKEQFESSGMKLGSPEMKVFNQTISANAYIAPSPAGWAKVSSIISGRVKRINFSLGDYIKKGQALFTLESNEIIMLQQEYAEAFNQLKSLKTSYDRQKVLADEGVSSQKNLISAESDYKTLLAKAEGLKAQLKMINIDIRKVEDDNISSSASIYAPIGGFVTQQKLVLGQFIEPQEFVVELIDMDKLQLNIHVFEKDLSELAVGQEVVFYNLESNISEFKAIITHLGRSIDADTKTIQCTARIISGERNTLVNGLLVEATIITCQREALSLPTEALFKVEDHYVVLSFIEEIEGNMIFHKTHIEPGIVQKEFTEVFDEDLKDILIEGGYNLQFE